MPPASLTNTNNNKRKVPFVTDKNDLDPPDSAPTHRKEQNNTSSLCVMHGRDGGGEGGKREMRIGKQMKEERREGKD